MQFTKKSGKDTAFSLIIYYTFIEKIHAKMKENYKERNCDLRTGNEDPDIIFMLISYHPREDIEYTKW